MKVPFLDEQGTPPQAYVLRPPAPVSDSPSRRQPVRSISFEMVLLGDAARYAPFVTYAIADAAAEGLGTRRAKFNCAGVQWMDTKGRWVPAFPDRRDALRPADFAHDFRQPVALPSSVRLVLVTPLDLRKKDQEPLEIAAGDGFVRRLVYSVAQRALHLAQFYHPWLMPDWNFGTLLDAADSVSVRMRDVVAWRSTRLSTTQGRSLPLEGLIGSIVLADVPPLLSPILSLASLINVGRKTTHGFGRIEFTPA